jgi:hypothetical protein
MCARWSALVVYVREHVLHGNTVRSSEAIFVVAFFIACWEVSR